MGFRKASGARTPFTMPGWLLAQSGIGPAACDGCEPSRTIRVEVLSDAEEGRPESVRITPPFQHVFTPAEWDSIVQESYTETPSGGFEARAAAKGLGSGTEHGVLCGRPGADVALVEIRSVEGGPPVHAHTRSRLVGCVPDGAFSQPSCRGLEGCRSEPPSARSAEIADPSSS